MKKKSRSKIAKEYKNNNCRKINNTNKRIFRNKLKRRQRLLTKSKSKK